MKKVFTIARRWFWACNGKPIAVEYIHWESKLDSRTGKVKNEHIWMKRHGVKRPFRITFVDPPPGRCPHCGEKT